MDDSPLRPPKPKQFFDIVPANKKVPDSSSRPLVVTNKPKQDDPMVKQPPAKEKDSTPPPKATSSTSITINEAMESASEPIKLDTPKEPEAPKPESAADTSTPDTESKPSDKDDKEPDLDNMPLELPANTPRDVIVSHHGYSGSTIRSILKVILIIILLVVIADLILDLGYIKSGIWHTHFFGS